MSNLYNRTLLDEFDSLGIQELLDEALSFADQQSSMDSALRKAICTRLTLRKRLLSALEFDLGPHQHAQIRHWQHCLELLPEVRQSHRLSKPVENAFSIKIQRTLASSVPPRPMVQNTFEETHTFLSNLCRDAADVYRVLSYYGCSNILVRI